MIFGPLRRFLPGGVVAGALLGLQGCATPLPAEHAAFAGDWQGLGMRLVITPDGGVAYRRLRQGMRISLTGPLKSADHSRIEAGIGPFATTFTVERPPRLEDGVWKMTVDGVELTRRP